MKAWPTSPPNAKSPKTTSHHRPPPTTVLRQPLPLRRTLPSPLLKMEPSPGLSRTMPETLPHKPRILSSRITKHLFLTPKLCPTSPPNVKSPKTMSHHRPPPTIVPKDLLRLVQILPSQLLKVV